MRIITINKQGHINKNAKGKALSAIGTSFKSEIEITYSELVTMLGEPNVRSDGYKVDAGWNINTPYGIATIYNYKTGKNYLGEKGKELEDITDWHIGASDKRASDLVMVVILKDELQR